MKRELPGPWFAVALMLIPLLAAWLGLAGPVDLSKLEKWQTLIAALFALGAAIIAWRGTRSTQVLNLLMREEDKLEKELSSLRDVLGFLLAFTVPIPIEHAETARNAFITHGIPTDELNILATLEKAIPGANQDVRRDVLLLLHVLSIFLKKLRQREDELREARKTKEITPLR